MASDRAEVDTARPFRSVREAVAVFGERILVGDSHSKNNGSAITIAATNGRHEDTSSSSVTAISPNATMSEREIEVEIELEIEAEATPAVVPMYSAPSSPPSFASSRSPAEDVDDDEENDHGEEVEGGAMVMSSIKKLEAEVAETRQEVVQLRKRSTEMEMAVASLNAQLHRGLSKLAEMEADKAAAAAATRSRSIGGDTDVTARSERWAGAYSGEYLPSFSHALSLGELDDGDELIVGGRRRKAQKVKPIVPLIGGMLFSRSRSAARDKQHAGDDGFFSGDLYSVLR